MAHTGINIKKVTELSMILLSISGSITDRSTGKKEYFVTVTTLLYWDYCK